LLNEVLSLLLEARNDVLVDVVLEQLLGSFGLISPLRCIRKRKLGNWERNGALQPMARRTMRGAEGEFYVDRDHGD
jgi:hypothetical protein